MSEHALQEIRDLYFDGDLPGALELCRALDGAGSQAGPAFQVLYGTLQMIGGEPSEGEAKFRSAAEVAPTTAAWASDLGFGLFLLRDLVAARKVLEQAIAMPGADGIAYGRLGAIFLASDDLENATHYYQEAVGREPGRAHWHHNLGVILVKQQRLTEALEHFETALRNKPDFELSLASRQRLLIALERTEDAVAQMEQIVEKSPEDMNLRLLLARMLDLDNRPQEATAQLREATKLDEKSVAPFLEVAAVFNRRGMPGHAVRALKKAEKIDPKDLNVQNALARALNEGNRHKQALETIEKALEVEPEARPLKVTRAQILSEIGDYETAERELRALLEVYPGDAGLLSTLGFTLMWIGRIDEAVTAFEESAKINPMALAHMVQARALPDDPAVIERMETFAANVLLPDETRFAMGFALAQLWQKAKDYDRAFEHLHVANRLARKTIRYDADRFTDKVDRFIETFTPEFFAQYEGAGHTSERPIFVCGMPRSGTTLVEQILSSHPQIYGAGELPLMPNLVRMLPKVLGQEEAFPACLEAFDRRAARNAAGYYLRNLREIDAETRFVVDKMPHNFLYLGLIAMILPNAKIVHMQRDPRDVAVSNYFQNFKAKHGLIGYAFDLTDMGRHLRDHDRMMAHWHDVLPIEIYECNYEELVHDQDGKTRELLEFIGVDWSDQVLEFHESERAVRTASVWQVRQPMYQSSSQKWRRYENHLGPLNEALLEPQPPALRVRSGG